MTPKTSALDRGSNTVQLLSALQGNTADTNRSGNFGQVLENSMQPRPTETARPQGRDPERPREAQALPTRDTGARPTEEQSKPPAGQGHETRPESSARSSAAEADQAETAGNRQAPTEQTDPATETTDPAKLAVLAAVIAALRGNAATTETEEGAPLPSTRTTQAATTSTLNSDAEGKSGDRPGETKTASSAAQLAAAKTPAATEPAKPVAPMRAPDAVSTLASASVPGRNAAANPVAAENPANLPSTAPITAPRAEMAAVQKMLVPTPAGQRLWADDVANRVIWMAGRGDGRAELILTPPNLGKLGVSIQMSGEQTTAHFVTSSAAAREALEQALPRLREALQQAGITLGDTSVSTSGDQQTRNGDEGSSGGDRRAQSNEYGILPEAAELANNARWTQGGTNLVDIFA